jgi:osmotically-inducible protein OsmY
MTKRFWIQSFIALAALGMVGACTSSSRTTETTGEYIDDASITAKVKSAVLAEPGLKTMQISVETYRDVVQLSGFVDTSQAKTKAGDVAANVSGVRSVRNNLVVK